MTYARRLCGVVWYDLRVGITRNRSVYVLLCMTFVLLAIFANSALQSADVPLALSWTDYALYASRGTPIPMAGQPKVTFPMDWLLPQVVLALLVAGSTSVDAGGYGVQVLYRAQSRASWWSAMWICTVLTVLSSYAIAAITWLAACWGLGNGQLTLQPEVQATISGLDFADTTGGAIAGLLVLPVLTSLAISTIQMTLSLLIRPLIGILVVIGYLLASALVHSPVLIAGTSMIARNALFDPQGTTTPQAAAVSVVVCVAVAICGGAVFNRKDLLSRSRL